MRSVPVTIQCLLLNLFIVQFKSAFINFSLIANFVIVSFNGCLESDQTRFSLIANFEIVSFNGCFESCHTRAVSDVKWRLCALYLEESEDCQGFTLSRVPWFKSQVGGLFGEGVDLYHTLIQINLGRWVCICYPPPPPPFNPPPPTFHFPINTACGSNVPNMLHAQLGGLGAMVMVTIS